ncbi:MAG: MBL fold metallo-hydrolase [Microthrixaceae bacterium]|jgi:ribonuclease BN (tRNA processing enzyme)|nr:MBL fold metallo-hydrolase [Microthrixaceae bacterium]
MGIGDRFHHHRGHLTVTVLGSAASFGHPGNACSGYLIQTPSTSVWLDCGPGSMAVLQEHLRLTEIDAVVVTHEHHDHWLELPLLRTAARYGFDIAHIPVFGTAGTRGLLEGLVGRELAPLEWTDITDGSSVMVGDLGFRFSATDHPVETLAVGVASGGRRFAYSADTGPGWSLASLDPEGEGFDLALCEATLAEVDAGLVQHLTARQAGVMARSAGARRLAVTHIYEGTGPERVAAAAADDAFAGPVELALPGHHFTV